MPEDSQFDRRLLHLAQEGIPLVREPYAQIAGEIGTDESALLDRLSTLRGEGGAIREISGIFDVQSLGYDQALVGFRIPDEHLDLAGQTVAAHPGISHCYHRDGKYNLWFTLAVSPRSAFGLRGTLDALARASGAESHLLLPALKRYKLHVRFGQDDSPEHRSVTHRTDVPDEPARASASDLTEEQIRAIAALQADLPNTSDPFAPVAASAGLDPDMLLVHATDMLARGYLRRYAAVLHHQRVGAKANVMVAWEVAEPAADSAGAKCAQHPAVSHCFLRPSAPDWSYNLYTMIHGRSRQDCEMTVAELAAETALTHRTELWTLREYKKQRIRLFSDQEAIWESELRGTT